MNGNETPLAPLAGKAVNEAFAGSNPAPRTIKFQQAMPERNFLLRFVEI
jgi:hypothetical protein